MENRYQFMFENAPKIYKELPSLKTDKIIEWLKNKVFVNGFIFYDKKKKTAICSNCGEIEMPQHARHKTEGTCPNCGKHITFHSAGIGRGNLEMRVRVLIFQRKGKSVYATLNMIVANYTGGEVKLYKDTEAVYKFNRKEQLYYYTKYNWYEGGFWSQPKNIRIPYRTGMWKDAPIYTYKGNIKEAFAGTDLKYCQLAEQEKDWYTESFIKLVDLNAKYSSVEKLHKVGLDKLIESKILGYSGSAAVKWKKDNLKDILGLTRPEILEAAKNNITMADLAVYKKAKKLQIKMTFDNAKKCRCDDLCELQKLAKYDTAGELFKYFKKQLNATYYSEYYKGETRAFYSVGNAISDYKDYIGECEKLGLDLNNKTIRLPKNLKEAHQRTSAQVKVIADKLQKQAILRLNKKLQKLNYEDENLFVRVAKNANEIIKEGKLQGHCVGGYVKKVARGTSAILFVRKKEKPNEPYYTLELQPNKKMDKFNFIQCRGEENCNMTPEVKEFIDKWMATDVNAKPKKKRKVA